MTSVDLSPALVPLIQLGGAALTIFGSWALLKLANLLGLKADAVTRGYVHSAVETAVAGAQADASRLATEYGHVNVRNEQLAQATKYVVNSVPDGLKQLGVTPDAVRAIVDAKLKAADAENAAATPATVAQDARTAPEWPTSANRPLRPPGEPVTNP